MGPVTGVSKPTSFEIDFDRPIDPNLIRNNPNFGPSFTAANVQVEYHDTTLGSAFKSLYVTRRQPDPARSRRPERPDPERGLRLHPVQGDLQSGPAGRWRDTERDHRITPAPTATSLPRTIRRRRPVQHDQFTDPVACQLPRASAAHHRLVGPQSQSADSFRGHGGAAHSTTSRRRTSSSAVSQPMRRSATSPSR